MAASSSRLKGCGQLQPITARLTPSYRAIAAHPGFATFLTRFAANSPRSEPLGGTKEGRGSDTLTMIKRLLTPAVSFGRTSQ
jgi:hypothetical protein